MSPNNNYTTREIQWESNVSREENSHLSSLSNDDDDDDDGLLVVDKNNVECRDPIMIAQSDCCVSHFASLECAVNDTKECEFDERLTRIIPIHEESIGMKQPHLFINTNKSPPSSRTIHEEPPPTIGRIRSTACTSTSPNHNPFQTPQPSPTCNVPRTSMQLIRLSITLGALLDKDPECMDIISRAWGERLTPSEDQSDGRPTERGPRTSGLTGRVRRLSPPPTISYGLLRTLKKPSRESLLLPSANIPSSSVSWKHNLLYHPRKYVGESTDQIPLAHDPQATFYKRLLLLFVDNWKCPEVIATVTLSSDVSVYGLGNNSTRHSRLWSGSRRKNSSSLWSRQRFSSLHARKPSLSSFAKRLANDEPDPSSVTVVVPNPQCVVCEATARSTTAYPFVTVSFSIPPFWLRARRTSESRVNNFVDACSVKAERDMSLTSSSSSRHESHVENVSKRMSGLLCSVMSPTMRLLVEATHLASDVAAVKEPSNVQKRSYKIMGEILMRNWISFIESDLKRDNSAAADNLFWRQTRMKPTYRRLVLKGSGASVVEALCQWHDERNREDSDGVSSSDGMDSTMTRSSTDSEHNLEDGNNSGANNKQQDEDGDDTPAIMRLESRQRFMLSHAAVNNQLLAIETGDVFNELKEKVDVCLYVFFGGKDMLALDWLSFVSRFYHFAIDKKSADAIRKIRLEAEARLAKHIEISRKILQGEKLTDEDLRVAEALRRPDVPSVKSLDHMPSGESELECEIRSTVLLYEMPAYGFSSGLPCPDSCTASALNTINTAIKSLKGHSAVNKVRLHLVGYSLGASVALRVANAIAQQIAEVYDLEDSRIKAISNFGEIPDGEKGADASEMPKSQSTGSLASAEALPPFIELRSLTLIAPFTSVADCAANILRIPAPLKSAASTLISRFETPTIAWDNLEEVKKLGRVMLSDNRSRYFSSFKFGIVHGTDDSIVPPAMSQKLIEALKTEMNRALFSRRGSRGESSPPVEVLRAGESIFKRVQMILINGATHQSIILNSTSQNVIHTLLYDSTMIEEYVSRKVYGRHHVCNNNHIKRPQHYDDDDDDDAHYDLDNNHLQQCS